MALTSEKTDILAMLADQRQNFRITLRGVTEEQARQRSTVSELTLGGLLHHVVNNERSWIKTIADLDETSEFDMSRMGDEYVMGENTVAGLLEEFDAVAAATEKFVEGLDLDTAVPLPTAPWAPERTWQSARFTLLHILREVAQHAGHADIIRESLDGASTTMAMASDAGLDW